ncbi:MAG: flagellar basal body rod protein FlgB [Proteocatella sp.]
MNKLFSNSIDLTQKSLDYLWKKQGVISENIANQDTPGYKTRFLTFEDELRSRLVRENNSLTGEEPGAKGKFTEIIGATDFKLNIPEDESVRMDENNVNTDAEYVELARASLQYQYSVRAISDEFARIRSAIRG